LISKKFGRADYLVSKWYKEYNHKPKTRDGSYTFPKDWWADVNAEWDVVDIVDAVRLYDGAIKSKEAYAKARREAELPIGEHEFDDLKSTAKYLKYQIENKIFDNVFFSRSIIEDIASKKITDLKPYKNLSFSEAMDAYDKKRTFFDIKPIKTYKNGWKWIDVGKQCQLVGKAMKNCGSTGVMSRDPDKTIITLFDINNKPHVVVTYSPNEKRISSDEGVAGSIVKNKYHHYILDLSKLLNAHFDAEKSKSKLLKLKYILANKVKSIKLIDEPPQNTNEEEFFVVNFNDGTQYYSDGFYLIPKSEIEKLSNNNQEAPVQILTNAFRYNNRNKIKGVVKVPGSYEAQQESFSVSRFKKLAGVMV